MRTLVALLLFCVPAYAGMKDDCEKNAVEMTKNTVGKPRSTHYANPAPGRTGPSFIVEIDTAANNVKKTTFYGCEFVEGRAVVRELF